MDHSFMKEVQIRLSSAERADFGRRPLLAMHNLEQHDLFTDAALAELLDSFPREHLYALTMGEDLTRPDENKLALHDNVSGAELLRAVRNGRLWLNVTRIDRADSRYRKLIDQLYEQLANEIPDFRPLASQGTLLISSPHAIVYYHADAAASALWHIRGRKRIWIYPALHRCYASREFLEDIFAGVRHEYLPYQHSFDRAAVCYELEPGQWTTWPQNAPHRVTNLDSLNVSLSTEHFTAATRQRQRVYLANRFFRTRLGINNLSTREKGLRVETKIFLHRVANKCRLDPVVYRSHPPLLRVDPDAHNGVVELETRSMPDAMPALAK
jgi:hypothetical protein